MPSHMTSIGFNPQTADDFGRLQLQTAQQGQPIHVDDGYYIRWEVGQGAELWAQANEKRELMWLNPHFSGTAVWRIAIGDHIKRPDTPLEGAYFGWVNPPADYLDSGDYPLIFDAPDDACTRHIARPQLYDVQLAAFAHHLDAFPDTAAFQAAQEGGISYAVESFVPTGAFVPEGQLPQAAAVFSGHVVATNVRINPVTNLLFHWIRVKTFGGEIDVVADPAVIGGRVLQGGVISGSFWLSGRILAD